MFPRSILSRCTRCTRRPSYGLIKTHSPGCPQSSRCVSHLTCCTCGSVGPALTPPGGSTIFRTHGARVVLSRMHCRRFADVSMRTGSLPGRCPNELSGVLKQISDLKPNWPSGHGKEKKKVLTSYIVQKRPKRRFKKSKKKGSSSARTFFFARTRRQSLPLGRFRGGRATQKVDQAKPGARTRR